MSDESSWHCPFCKYKSGKKKKFSLDSALFLSDVEQLRNIVNNFDKYDAAKAKKCDINTPVFRDVLTDAIVPGYSKAVVYPVGTFSLGLVASHGSALSFPLKLMQPSYPPSPPPLPSATATFKAKLDRKTYRKTYKTLRAFLFDMRMMFVNCRLFNGPDTFFGQYATDCEEHMQHLVKTYLNKYHASSHIDPSDMFNYNP